MKESSTDDKLINDLTIGGSALDHAMKSLFADEDLSQQLNRYVTKNGGSQFDAEDVLQEGIRNLIMNIRAGKYAGAGSLKAYLMMICKNLWLTQFKRRIHLNKIKESVQPDHHTIESPETHLLWSERATIMQDVLGQVGDVCKEILGLWSLGYSFKEIGEKTNRNEGAARKQKHSCFKKLMLFLKNNPALMNELKQLKIQ